MRSTHSFEIFRAAGGAIGCLLALALPGCGSKEPASSKTSQFEVAEDAPKAEADSTEEKTSAPAGLEKVDGSKAESARGKEAVAAAEMLPENGEEQDSGQASAPKPGETGLYKPPKGPPAAQIEFIKKLSELPPRGGSRQSQLVDYEDRMNAIIASCGIVLKHKTATEEQKNFAISTKFLILTEMSVKLEEPEYAQQAMAFAAELQASPKGTIERELGVAIGVELLPQQFGLVEKPTEKEVKRLLEGYFSYLDDGPLQPMLHPGLAITRQLNDKGYRDEAMNVLETMIAKCTEEKELPDRDVIIADLNGQLRLLKLDIPVKLRAARTDEAAYGAVEAAFDELFANEAGESKWLQFLYGVGATLEKAGQTKSAAKAYARLEKQIESAKEEKVAAQVKELLATAKAREKLLGQPLDFTAEIDKEKEFKLSSLKGKLVLVLFWSALDQGASVQELSNVEQTLLETKSAFDVVLVNIDDDPEVFRQFSEFQPIKWAAASIRCPGAATERFGSDLEKQVGLDQLPFGILLNREGKVEALFAQGERLRALVEKAEAPSAEDTKAAEEPPKKDAPAETKAAEKEKAAPSAEEPQ